MHKTRAKYSFLLDLIGEKDLPGIPANFSLWESSDPHEMGNRERSQICRYRRGKSDYMHYLKEKPQNRREEIEIL